MDTSHNTSISQDHVGDEEANVISIEQLQRLIRLLDRSDVFEVELKHANDGTRLLLRKAKVSESYEHPVEAASDLQFPAPSSPPSLETKHKIAASLVGIFHTWAKPRGKPLVSVGDRVKEGQLVATIESLNVINDVESSVAGHIVEILVQEGQPVEYGQHLMTVDSSPQSEGA